MSPFLGALTTSAIRTKPPMNSGLSPIRGPVRTRQAPSGRHRGPVQPHSFRRGYPSARQAATDPTGRGRNQIGTEDDRAATSPGTNTTAISCWLTEMECHVASDILANRIIKIEHAYPPAMTRPKTSRSRVSSLSHGAESIILAEAVIIERERNPAVNSVLNGRLPFQRALIRAGSVASVLALVEIGAATKSITYITAY